MGTARLGVGVYELTLSGPATGLNVIPVYGLFSPGYVFTFQIFLGVITVNTLTSGLVPADRDFTIHVVDGTP